MSNDVEYKALTPKERKLMMDEIEFWLKQARESDHKSFSVAAAGVAAGLKIAADR